MTEDIVISELQRIVDEDTEAPVNFRYFLKLVAAALLVLLERSKP